MSKEKFFTHDYIPYLKKLNGTEKAMFGVLSPQGMIEHMTDSIGIAWGRIKEKPQLAEDVMERARTFALSDKEFKPGTKNSLMTETPAPLRNKNMPDAIHELDKEIHNFINYYKNNPHATVTNPFYGDFNYDQWLHLLHKHAIHHLKQFNLFFN